MKVNEPKTSREAESVGEIIVSLTSDQQERLEVIRSLLEREKQEDYGKYQEKVAKKLGISVRTLRRWLQRYRREGIASVVKQPRSDSGKLKIASDWQDFIMRTYKEGNRGSRKMSKAQVYLRVRVRASELGREDHPSHMTVYRLLNSYEEQKKRDKRVIGCLGEELTLKSREGLEIKVEYSNQVWQSDHTKVDLLVVGQNGEILGRPWLTTVIDSYSRCIMGINLGFDAPSAEVVGLALRHAILPKQYTSAYQLKESWETYGLPQYIYTDGGKDFRSQHLERVAMELGIVLCLRRKPSDGGIVERPFGTLNQELLSSLPGYTGSNVSERSQEAEKEACLTLRELEQLLVRYIVDNYNQRIDARMGNQSRIGRWEAGRIAELSLLGERELDISLMRKERRRVST
ncbi:MAG: helix-turn-helix domain-containing protein [Xenococcus sp. (in: cyanobacteria)]